MNEERAVKAEGSLPYCTGKKDLWYLLDVPHRHSLRSLPMSGNQPFFNEFHVCSNPFPQNVPGFLRRQGIILLSQPFTLNLPFADNDRHSTVSLLCPLSAYTNADNTDNWKDAKLPYFPELVDFLVSCWLLMRYRKTRNLFPEDFKSFASYSTKTDYFLWNKEGIFLPNKF